MKQESIKSGKYSWPRAVNMEKGPYYFISYCHRNGVMISHDLSILASYEVPFWYDDGMIPGKDWLERATEAMSHKNCVGVIFFITKTSLHSSPIFQELKLAMRLSAEKENFSIISVHAGGKQISKWISEGAVPSEYQATYSTAFPDGNIAIMRKNAIDSTDHIPLLLEIFHHSGLLKHKYKSVLERSAFVTKPYMNGHMIVAYRGKSSSVIVPYNIHGKKIIAIGPDVFMNDKSIHNVQIEAGIIEVMDSAFSGCINLKTVRLSESLQYIGHECFKF